MFTGLFLIKMAAIVILLIVISYLLFRRLRSKSKADAQFKHNVGLLRSEKLLIHIDKKQQKKRQQLIKKAKIFEDVNQVQLMIKSKKLRMPAGEILLAAKIQMCSN
jgi:maltose-binding protein MalE